MDRGCPGERAWRLSLKLAGVIGVDPGPFTLDELIEMGNARRMHDAALCGELWAVIANSYRDPKKRPRPFEARDRFPFLPRPKRRRMTLSPEDKAALRKSMGRAR